MAFSGFPFDALLLEACQPYYRYHVPQESHKARRCVPAPSAQAAPRFNASETSTAYKLYIALPGLERKDIAINANEGVLSLEVSRAADPALDTFRTIPAKLHRMWKLPESVDVSGICARLANGELVVTLPKLAKAEPRRVLITDDEPAPPAAPALEAADAAPAAAAPVAATEANVAAATEAMETAPAGGNNVASPVNADGAKSEEDGSVEDLSDEEREAERAARRRRALASEAGPVLMDADEAPTVAA
ncbi:hypothetical protein WJX81_008313 [Elliptochloris bilobata]|uniref:SHSP domain-containing protein n=1 Tax=Elliptochloris bilobata TaxID=381761 RepID=A0AAW1RGV4_9CHLO